MKKNFVNLRGFLINKYPQLERSVRGENYPVAYPLQILATYVIQNFHTHIFFSNKVEGFIPCIYVYIESRVTHLLMNTLTQAIITVTLEPQARRTGSNVLHAFRFLRRTYFFIDGNGELIVPQNLVDENQRKQPRPPQSIDEALALLIP